MSKKIFIGKDIIKLKLKDSFKKQFGEDFSKAVQLILEVKKYNIYRLSKSGYIARKVSSSFKSTGISSLYLILQK